jgi:hypothetical protein
MIYDACNLLFLLAQNVEPQFLLTGLQVVIHGVFLHAEGLGDFQHGEPLRKARQ